MLYSIVVQFKNELTTIVQTLKDFKPSTTPFIEFKNVLKMYINAEPQYSEDDKCIDGLKKDLNPQMVY